MSVRMIQDRLDGYGCRTALEEEQTLREITQEIVLAAIGRTDFFQKAGFQGGTCLRIFHGLNRFSFIWYTARGTRVNHGLLASALAQQGPWKGKQPHVDRDWCLAQLRHRIEATDWNRAREDVRRFVKPEELPSLHLWSLDFFLAQCNKLGS